MANKPKEFKYTYEDIAELAGVTKQAVYKASSEWLIEPEKLSSVLHYILHVPGKNPLKAGAPTPEEQLARLEGKIGFGLNLQGAYEGQAVVSLDGMPTTPEFNAIKVQVEAVLSEMGLQYINHPLDDGMLSGWVVDIAKVAAYSA